MTQSRKIAIQESLLILLGVALFVAVMLGVYWLLGFFTVKVLYSALLGTFLAGANFFVMAMVVTLAADRAETRMWPADRSW